MDKCQRPLILKAAWKKSYHLLAPSILDVPPNCYKQIEKYKIDKAELDTDIANSISLKTLGIFKLRLIHTIYFVWDILGAQFTNQPLSYLSAPSN